MNRPHPPRMTALLLAALCASAATQAQSSVQLMGLTDVFVGSLRNAGDPGRATVLNSGGMTTSQWGFRGQEDLGGGLKAVFGTLGSGLLGLLNPMKLVSAASMALRGALMLTGVGAVLIGIAMAGGFDSLNVAATSAVALHHLTTTALTGS